jgi:hypothetical protein
MHDHSNSDRMIGRRGLLAGIGAVPALTLLSGCVLLRPSAELRYRLTVEVDTPSGLKTGFSVIAVRVVKNPDWLTPEGRGTRTSFRGEAVAVDVAPGKTLFALLRTASGLSGAADYPWFAFRDLLHGAKDRLDSIRTMQQWKGRAIPITGTEELHADNQIKQVSVLPMLVAFTDIKDARSVVAVEPNALNTAFGSGMTLRRITVAVTDDDVSTGVEKRLPRFGKATGYLDWRKTLPNDDTRRRLTRNDFISTDNI